MKIIEEISRGGFGRVEKVQLGGGIIAARKVFDPVPDIIKITNIPKLKKRFKREVKVQSSLKSDCFMKVLSSNLDNETPWFIMPLAERNLWDEIEKVRDKNSDPQTSLGDILNALEELHSLGFVHRDLKPQNILFHEGRWKLSDFGLVLPSTEATTKLTSLDSAWGTTGYCAPEQAQDFRNATFSVDIYAFGCILHDLYEESQRIPYHKYTSSGPIGMIIEKCTEINPKKRFKSVTALRGSLLRILSEPQNLTPSPSATEWLTKLENLPSWNIQQLEEFARFMKKNHNESDLWVVCRGIDEEILKRFHEIDEDFWLVIALTYCEWASKESFGFDYCDVIIKRLEMIFVLGNLEAKASAALAGAALGWSHSRWFVMKRVIRILNSDLDELIAQRIAIEIQVEEAQRNFISCAEEIKRSINHYHPLIAEVLVQFQKDIKHRSKSMEIEF
ncbi:MAG: protein kinase [Elainellaceae cyanobacterium]